MRRSLGMLLLLALTAATAAAAPPSRITGEVRSVTMAKGDTLRAIGSRLGVDPATIAADNGLRLNASLAVGTVLRVDNRHIIPLGLEPDAILINVPQRLLFFGDGEGVRALPVAVGRTTWRSPLSAFSVVVKEVDPSWEVPASIQAEARSAGRSLPSVVPPGPDNPLGKRWLGLSIGGVGIHGTNAPSSVYQATTHGCIRVHPDDIEWLFEQVEVGTPGRLAYEPVLLAADGTDVFLEVHRDVYKRGPDEPLAYARAVAAGLGVDAQVDWVRAARVIAERAGIARIITRAR